MSVQTTVVGSYPVPEWLRAYPTRPHLDDAMLVVIRTQELAGIDLVSDGELTRFDVSHPETNGMIEYFTGQLDGIRTRIGIADLQRFEETEGMGYRTRPAGVVTAPIAAGVLNLPAAARPLRRLATTRTKFTLTSPYMLAKVLLDLHYGDRAELCMAIADVLRQQVRDVDADVLQIDEANLTGNPDDGELAAAAINRVFEDWTGERAVHLCFGNYAGQTVQQGSYERLLPFMNALTVDHLVLELARRDNAELETLRGLDPRIGIGLGVIDIKDNAVEDPDDIARDIDAAERTLGPDRVRYVNPDCGLWMLPRTVADAKLRALTRGRDLYQGKGGAS